MSRLYLRSPNDDRIDYQFRVTGEITSTDDAHERVDGNEVEGHLSTGDDVIGFDGLPFDFAASDPWELDIWLDMGVGAWRKIVPPFLNAAEIQLRSDGAHYLLSLSGPGTIIPGAHAESARSRDAALDGAGRLAIGNVKNGNLDSFRIWPPMVGFDAVADNPTEARVPDAGDGWGEWVSVPVVNPPMEF